MKDLTNIEIAGLLETTKNKFNENGKTYAVLTEAQERLISIPMQLPAKPVDYGTCKNCIFNLETDENGIGLYAVRHNLQKLIRSTTVIILKYF